MYGHVKVPMKYLVYLAKIEHFLIQNLEIFGDFGHIEGVLELLAINI